MKKYKSLKVLSTLFLSLTMILLFGAFLLTNMDRLEFCRNISEQVYVSVRGTGHVFNDRIINILRVWITNLAFTFSVLSYVFVMKTLRYGKALLYGVKSNLVGSATVYTSEKSDTKKMKKAIKEKNKEEKNMLKKLNLKAKKEAKKAEKLAKKANKKIQAVTEETTKAVDTAAVASTEVTTEISAKAKKMQDILKSIK